VHIGCFLISSSRARSLDCRFFKTDRGDVIRSRTWKSRSRANHDAEQRKSNGFVHECSKCYLGSKRGFPRAAGPRRALFMHTAHRVYPRYTRARPSTRAYGDISYPIEHFIRAHFISWREERGDLIVYLDDSNRSLSPMPTDPAALANYTVHERSRTRVDGFHEIPNRNHPLPSKILDLSWTLYLMLDFILNAEFNRATWLNEMQPRSRFKAVRANVTFARFAIRDLVGTRSSITRASRACLNGRRTC
jgi:hypothetical protein